MLDTFMHLSSDTLTRIAEHIEHGGSPLSSWECRIAGRALRIADGDNEDAAALLYVAADEVTR